jgi:hypothetical protein
MLFQPPERFTFLAAACGEHQADGHIVMRARGWALALGLAYVANSSDDRAMTVLGLATVRNALRS